VRGGAAIGIDISPGMRKENRQAGRPAPANSAPHRGPPADALYEAAVL